MLRLGLSLSALLASGLAHAAGSLQVGSVLPGAAITLDGVDTNQVTPALLEGLSAGPHQLRLTGQCMLGTANVQVVDDQLTELTVDMSVVGGKLIINPTPQAASISLDGEPMSGAVGAPIPVSCGPHAVAASESGYRPSIITVDVGPGEDVVLAVPLDPLGFGQLDISVDPKGTALLLDGEPAATGSSVLDKVIAGPHVLRAEAPGYVPLERQFVLSEGQEASFELNLQRLPRAARPKSAKRSGGGHGLRVVGVGLGLAGIASGAYAALEYGQTADAYDEYLRRVDRVESSGGSIQASFADQFYSTDVAPHRNKMLAAGAASAVLLGSGVTMVIKF